MSSWVIHIYGIQGKNYTGSLSLQRYKKHIFITVPACFGQWAWPGSMSWCLDSWIILIGSNAVMLSQSSSCFPVITLPQGWLETPQTECEWYFWILSLGLGCEVYYMKGKTNTRCLSMVLGLPRACRRASVSVSGTVLQHRSSKRYSFNWWW